MTATFEMWVSPPRKKVYTPKKSTPTQSLHPNKVYTSQKTSTPKRLHTKKSTPPQAEDGLSEEQLVAVRVLRLETVPVGRIPFR